MRANYVHRLGHRLTQPILGRWAIPGPVSIKGYKAMGPDFTGFGGFKYKPGQTYELSLFQRVIPFEQGFHFSKSPYRCPDHYWGARTRYAEVEAWYVNEPLGDDQISTAAKLRIVREIPKEEMSLLRVKTMSF